MRSRIWYAALLLLSLVLVGIALAYSYLDIKLVSGIVRDPAGQPVAQAAVTLAGRSTLSDESGRFILTVPAGTWPLTVYADGFYGVQQTIQVDDLYQKDYSTDLTLPPNEFSATVIDAGTRQPLAGVAVTAGRAITVTTNAQGGFALQGLKHGTTLAFSLAGYRALSSVFEPGETSEFELAPAVTSAVVVDAATQLPLPNATVTAGDQSLPTDARGQVSLRALTPGTTVTALAPDHATGQAQYQGQQPLALALTANALEGTVIDAVSKKPLPKALITYNGVTLQPDARGAFHLDNLSGAISLTVKLPAYRLTTFQAENSSHLELALQPFKAKGIHIYYGMPRDAVTALLDRLSGTDVNAVVLDVKEGGGDIVWPSEVPLAQQIGAYHASGIAPSELIGICRAQNLYCIARMVIFKDTRLGGAHPEWALHYPGGGIYNAGNEIWMNPAKTQVWDYDIALAKELGALGFDEVQFDYIRYPGSPVPLEFGTADTRLQTIGQFLNTASTAFKPLPFFFSGDVFGLTTATKDEQGIGQRLEVDAPYFDYVSPMMYPSTWKGSPGLFRDGLNNPTCAAALACPYDIMFHGVQIASQRTGGALIRPWLQAYTDVGFGVPQYIQQKQGSDDANSAGWLFWNNQGIYPQGMFAATP